MLLGLMMDILSNEYLNGLPEKGNFEAAVYLVDYSVAQTSTGKDYLRATLSAKDGSIGAMVWSGEALDLITKNSLKGVVLGIKGEVNDYKGTRGIVIRAVTTVDTGVDVTEFLELRYDQESLQNDFNDYLARNLSPEAQKVAEIILGPVSDKFASEFAARAGGKNHDNVYGGLLAHSVKCAKVLDATFALYPHLQERVNKDALFLGTVLHDVGKTLEYKNGAMSELGSLVSHRTIAVEFIARKKKAIVELAGLDFYYRLMSIFAQHHGEYEEKPRTAEALIAHFVDNYESSMASLDQNLEKTPKGESVYFHGFFIS